MGKAQVPTKGKGKTQTAYGYTPYPEVSHSTWQAPEWWSARQDSQAPSKGTWAPHEWWGSWSTTQEQQTWGPNWTPSQSQAASSGSYSTGKGPRWTPTLTPHSGYKGTYKGKDPFKGNTSWVSDWFGKGTKK